MWNLKLCHVASGIQLLDNMLIHVVPLCLFIPDWSLQAYGEVQLLATDCQTDSRVISAFAPAPTEANDFNVARGRKKTQNLWPGCGGPAYDQFAESVSHRNWGTPVSRSQL